MHKKANVDSLKCILLRITTKENYNHVSHVPLKDLFVVGLGLLPHYQSPHTWDGNKH